jgi:hypothetical protein
MNAVSNIPMKEIPKQNGYKTESPYGPNKNYRREKSPIHQRNKAPDSLPN